MEVQPEITYRNVEPTEEIEKLVSNKLQKLEKICDHIISARVAIEGPHRHQRTGNPYRVRIDLTIPPGHEVVAKRESTKGKREEPLQTVIRNAFEAAQRQTRELVEKQRGQVKEHLEDEVNGFVSKIHSDEGYGFLKPLDGSGDIYFHRNSVLNRDFERLEIGAGVRFVAKQGEEGLQASTVELIDRPRPRVSKTSPEQEAGS
ncbi:MAG: HPF/RaiA family ribosome-associated protein [Dehalococcoidia bacterium]